MSVQTYLLRISFALLCVAIGSATANIRPPQIVWQPPSGSIGSQAAGLEIAGETLNFACTLQSCGVLAVYRVSARGPVTADFQFLMPGPGPLQVRVAGVEAAAQVSSYQPVSKEEASLFDHWSQDRIDLFQARFRGRLPAGPATIEVRYTQELGMEENDYDYSGPGRFMRFFIYSLWPLKGWTLTPDFVLELTVDIAREPPNWWRRHFGTILSIECRLPGGAANQEGLKLVYRARLGRDFPDTLKCFLGDDDLLPDPMR